ncbi:MAG: hypothetical protein WKF83_03325 [Nocardioidaceae bacterium]
MVRPVSGSSSAKTYRCPGCQQLIAPVTPHVVAWPVQKALLSDAAVDERRHWHTPAGVVVGEQWPRYVVPSSFAAHHRAKRHCTRVATMVKRRGTRRTWWRSDTCDWRWWREGKRDGG